MDASSRVSPLRQRMIDDMRLRKLSEKTQSHYLRWVQRFAAYLGRSPDTAAVEDLRGNQLYALVAAIAAQARAGDHVLVMSNGAFGGIHDKLLRRLAAGK